MIKEDFQVRSLGECTVQSPLYKAYASTELGQEFIKDDERILYDCSLAAYQASMDSGVEPVSFEVAGPRENIFFNPTNTKAAIVTCGGLCPGINNVIRGLVMGLSYRYNVKNIIGIKYGYEGLVEDFGHAFVELTPEKVKDIHQFGGSILGSSRGRQDISKMVDTLERHNINILFGIGGDGTLGGVHAIAEEVERRGLKIAVVGVPKTIDNDVNMVHKTFGFETAYTIAAPIIRDAHTEAVGAYNGIAIVKLMGRDSGFIAANAALAMPDVNFVLVPESEFTLKGPNGLLEALKQRIDQAHHAVIVVAEGAGQNLFDDASVEKDASGNIKHKDIGILLRDEIVSFFKQEKIEATVKYIDPSYIIRSEPANASDSIFCTQLAMNAVHGAMAGKTDFVVGRWNTFFTYLPIPIATSRRKKIDLKGDLWWSVLESTGQPACMNKK